MPGSALMARNMFPPALAPGLRHIFVHWLDLKEHAPQYTHYMNEDTSDDAYEIDWELSGTAPMPILTEGSAPATDGLISGGTKKVVHLEYGLLSEVTRQLVDDDKYRLFMRMPESHARSGMFAREAACCSLFNLGGTSITTTNGATLFNTAQPLMGGPSATSIAPNVSTIINSAGTYPNRPNPDADLTMTSLQQAVTMIALQPDDRGIPIHVKPSWLVHTVQQRRNVRELLGSPGIPGSSNNELNWVVGENLKGLELNYLTSPNAWFLIANKEGHQLKFYERKSLAAATDDDFKTQVLLFRSNQRFGVVATSWRGVFGSYGA
jgi:hypothetical protein